MVARCQIEEPIGDAGRQLDSSCRSSAVRRHDAPIEIRFARASAASWNVRPATSQRSRRIQTSAFAWPEADANILHRPWKKASMAPRTMTISASQSITRDAVTGGQDQPFFQLTAPRWPAAARRRLLRAANEMLAARSGTPALSAFPRRFRASSSMRRRGRRCWASESAGSP